MQLASRSEQPIDLGALHINPEAIGSPSLKIMLLRYLGGLEDPGVVKLISLFLDDSNKTVVIEALKALKGLTMDFDASPMLQAVPGMPEVARDLAVEVIEARADEKLAPKLAPLDLP